MGLASALLKILDYAIFVNYVQSAIFIKTWNMICFWCFIIFLAILLYEKLSGAFFLPNKILIWLLWSWQVGRNFQDFETMIWNFLSKTDIKILIFWCFRAILVFESSKMVSKWWFLNPISKKGYQVWKSSQKTYA